MPAAPRVYETTVFDPELESTGGILVIPPATLSALPTPISDEPMELAAALGLRIGVLAPLAEDVIEVVYASIAGRVVPFDDFSFDRWRRQRQEQPNSRAATFAVEFASAEIVPIEESPLQPGSLTGLATRGTAWTLAGTQFYGDHPVRGLGVMVLGEFGVVVASVARAFREELVIAAKFHLRRLFRVPPDWWPPDYPA